MEDVQIDDQSIYDSNEQVVFDNIHEYEDSNIREEDQKSKSFILHLVIVLCGLFIVSLLLNISDRLKSFYVPLGYISLVVFTILFIWFYIRPVWLFFKMDYFELNSSKETKIVKKHNAKVRKNIAKKIIDFQSNVKNSGWYDNDSVVKLNNALKDNDNDLICKYLTLLMNNSVKNASNKIIVNSAVQSAVYSAVSQSPQFDALLVISVNFKMIRDLIFLYGFRPTEPKLIKIALRVFFSSFAAYQISVVQIGTFFTSKLTAKSIPLVANGTGFLADAVIQAITNGTLTMWIGYKTLNYLMKEYKLQSLYEGIDILDDSDEFAKTRKQILDKITSKIPFIKKQLDNMTDNANEDNQSNENVKIDGVLMPNSSNHFIGRPFIDVQKKLLQIGFSIDNITLKSTVKKHKGLFNKDGEVVGISFDGNTNIEKGTRLNRDTNIEISYLTYL